MPDMSSTKERRRFVCAHEGCNKSFNRRDYLERHAANHLPVKPYYCEPCYRCFARGDLYENHLSTKFHIKRSSGISGTSPGVHKIHKQPTAPFAKRLRSATPQSPQSPIPPPVHFNGLLLHHPPVNTTPSTTPPLRINALSSIANSPNASPQMIPHHLTRINRTTTASPTAPYFDHKTPSPVQAAKRATYGWLFEDSGVEGNAAQDRLYSYYLDVYRANCDRYWHTPNFKHPPLTRQFVISHEKIAQVINVLKDKWLPATVRGAPDLVLAKSSDYPSLVSSNSRCGDMESLLEPLSLNITIAYYIDLVWTNIESMSEFIHRNSFDPNEQNPILLAAFVILGISLHEDEHIRSIARYLFTPVLVALRNELACRESFGPDEDVGLLQAYGILIRFDNQICGLGDRNEVHGVISGKWLMERYRAILQPTATQDYDRLRNQPLRTARLSRRGYEFIDGPDDDREAQWLEWAKYESCKRSAMFILYCDCVHTLSHDTDSSQLTIFDVDVHMPCAPSIWFALTPQEFHAIVGPSRVILSVPYLYILKSILRLPRLGEEVDRHPYSNAWPLFTQCCILYGLLFIARAMNNTTSTQQELIAKLNSRDEDGNWHVDFYDRGIQVRLSRGFDIWTKYFEAATALSENHHPFRMAGNKIENVNIIGHLQTSFNSAIFMDYILLILLHYHSAYILMHEDLKLILNVANELPFWLAQDPQPVTHHINFQLYEKWAKTTDAKTVVSAATLFLVRITAGHRFLLRQRTENLLLGLFTYYAVLIVWLYDKALNPDAPDNAKYQDPTDESASNSIIHDATVYLYYIWGKTNNQSTAPQSLARPAVGISSVIALGALLLKDTYVGQPQIGGQILHNLYKRLYLGYHHYQL